MNILNFIKKLFSNTNIEDGYHGAALDTRTADEKLKDYKFEEIVAAANPVGWIEKQQSEWRKFPIYHQNGSGSCVAQTMRKLLCVMLWLRDKMFVDFSATHIYQRRANKPGYGMAGVDAFNIARAGTTLNEFAPSDHMLDTQMDAAKIQPYQVDVGSVFKIGNFVQSPIGDIETVASIIQTTGKAVMVWFFFNSEEWTSVPKIIYPNLKLMDSSCARHSVAAVDYTLYQGKKALIIDESYGNTAGFGGQRVITEDFYKARNWFAAYPMNFKFDDQTQPEPTPTPAPTKPKYHFTSIMKFGFRSVDIKALQDILKYEGLFPTNTESTSYYGAVTAKAVMAFQRKYKVASEAEITALQGRSAGPKTIDKLNSLYDN